MDRIGEWREMIAIIDNLIEPIANRPVDIGAPDWMARLASRPHPLDEADVSAEAEEVLLEIITAYPTADEEARREIRELLAAGPSFSWAAKLPFEPDSAERFRSHLILFSIRDLGRDTRDAILQLDEICARAGAAGVAIAPILREVAALSSNEARHGMGSCRGLLGRKTESR